MLVGITNTPRDYAWGSTTEIASLLGGEPSGRPEAELWLGAHPLSPAVIVDPAMAGSARDLVEWIASAPDVALGSNARLPFLLKVLAADAPLSLQAHPSAEQAQEGFIRENALGIPVDAVQRNYKDPYPKPELIFAISETFEAVCGFRPLAEARSIVAVLHLEELSVRLDSLPNAVEWLIAKSDGVAELTARVTELASGPPLDDPIVKQALQTARMLAAEYPGDPGIVLSLLLNRVTLARGEALYLPAGKIHAYLSGVGIELMTASDNVLRGGLTPKHVDTVEFLNVLDFSTGSVPYLRPEIQLDSAAVYRPEGPGFALVHVVGESEYAISGPGIAICTAGRMSVAGATASRVLNRGEAVYITPDEARLTFSGVGELFLATTA